MVDIFGTGRSNKPSDEIVRENFSLTLEGIIETLNSRNVGYKQTTMYGHFGIDGLHWRQSSRLRI